LDRIENAQLLLGVNTALTLTFMAVIVRYKPYLDEQHLDPIEDAAEHGDLFVCIKRARLRVAASLQSKFTGFVEKDEVIRVLEQTEDDATETSKRVRCGGGWTSISAADGTKLFEPAPPEAIETLMGLSWDKTAKKAVAQAFENAYVQKQQLHAGWTHADKAQLVQLASLLVQYAMAAVCIGAAREDDSPPLVVDVITTLVTIFSILVPVGYMLLLSRGEDPLAKWCVPHEQVTEAASPAHSIVPMAPVSPECVPSGGAAGVGDTNVQQPPSWHGGGSRKPPSLANLQRQPPSLKAAGFAVQATTPPRQRPSPTVGIHEPEPEPNLTLAARAATPRGSRHQPISSGHRETWAGTRAEP
jgi:hypothetical protein